MISLYLSFICEEKLDLRQRKDRLQHRIASLVSAQCSKDTYEATLLSLANYQSGSVAIKDTVLADAIWCVCLYVIKSCKVFRKLSAAQKIRHFIFRSLFNFLEMFSSQICQHTNWWWYIFYNYTTEHILKMFYLIDLICNLLMYTFIERVIHLKTHY